MIYLEMPAHMKSEPFDASFLSPIFLPEREEAMQPYLYLVSHAHMHTHGTNERDGGNARERRRLNGMMGRGKEGKSSAHQ